ncbi:MAG: hypothetical protein LGR52_02195, partial [Candidatus Thiosymbion ectosymbiont of Robbea hypermnestra]|nr:hypothetical protein [Candidatus Thiosymbion ectosymbiont of Robbea hypermnestra]
SSSMYVLDEWREAETAFSLHGLKNCGKQFFFGPHDFPIRQSQSPGMGFYDTFGGGGGQIDRVFAPWHRIHRFPNGWERRRIYEATHPCKPAPVSG